MGMEPRLAEAAPERKLDVVTLAVALRSLPRRSFEVDEMLQLTAGVNGARRTTTPRRQTAGIERKIAATEAWRAAECRRDVPDGYQMRHLVDGYGEHLVAPALDGVTLVGCSPSPSVAHAERGVEIRAT
jgi:hypothetical protein